MTTAIRQINKSPGPVCMECVGYLLEAAGQVDATLRHRIIMLQYRASNNYQYTILRVPCEYNL